VSFDVRWAGHGEQRRIRDKRFGFSGRYVTGPATVTGPVTVREALAS